MKLEMVSRCIDEMSNGVAGNRVGNGVAELPRMLINHIRMYVVG